jgi:DNA-binding NtrC family response regulator
MTLHAKAIILVVDDTPENLRFLRRILKEQDYEVRAFSEGAFALESAYSATPDLILLDVKMPGMDGYAVCERLKADERTRDIPVIFVSALDDIDDKVKGFEAGGVDYITKPFQAEEVLARVRIHLLLQRLRNHLEDLVEERTAELQDALREVQQLREQLEAENIYLRQEIDQEHNVDGSNGGIIGQSQALRYVLANVNQVAPTNTTVLITGETGTGKELIARALHQASRRNSRPLVKVNCAALPAQLIESELFGHEKGAFTGATAKQVGRFELAHGGTIFLDEIGELPLELQPKLLRVLQDGEFERLGNPQTITVDARVIAATNRNLPAEVQAGRFRQDLYYRLHVYPLHMPPLRERLEDIPPLVESFVQKFNKILDKQVDTIPQHIMSALQQYAWPGNIRELENVIERAVITARDRMLRIDIPLEIAPAVGAGDKPLKEIERAYILHILAKTAWKIEGSHGAATILGLHPSTLRSRMQKLDIKRS